MVSRLWSLVFIGEEKGCEFEGFTAKHRICLVNVIFLLLTHTILEDFKNKCSCAIWNVDMYCIVLSLNEQIPMPDGSFFNSDATSHFFKLQVPITQVERQGERLSFSKISGNGPAKGWVSISLKGRALLERQTESTTKIESDWAWTWTTCRICFMYVGYHTWSKIEGFWYQRHHFWRDMGNPEIFWTHWACLGMLTWTDSWNITYLIGKIELFFLVPGLFHDWVSWVCSTNLFGRDFHELQRFERVRN